MDVSIGARIKAARTAAGMTQMDVARRTNLSLQAVGDIEREIVRDPHISSLRQIARALGIPVTQMLEDSFREPVPLVKAQAARDFLAQVPSAARRTEYLERAAGILEGYVRRWTTELECLTEKDVYPYGKGIETDHLYQGITKALQKGLMPYAVWITKERSEEVSARELAGARRLLEAVKSMASFVERARDTERQMRSDRGGVEQGLDEAKRFDELERLLTHVDSIG